MPASVKNEYSLTAINFAIEVLHCKNCQKPFSRTERVDTVEENGHEESFCLPCWGLLIKID